MLVDSLTDLYADAKAQLRRAGLKVRQLEDFSEVKVIAEAIEKPYMTGYLDPAYNDFFSRNSFWMIFYTEDDEAVGMIGVRKDFVGNENLQEMYRRRMKSRNRIVDEANLPESFQPSCADRMAGTLVYVGDLFFGKRARSFGHRYLPATLRLVFLTALLKWDELDWYYAFLEDRNAQRGVAQLYGFLRCYPFANSWTADPNEAEFKHHLMCMTKNELLSTLQTEHSAREDRDVWNGSNQALVDAAIGRDELSSGTVVGIETRAKF